MANHPCDYEYEVVVLGGGPAGIAAACAAATGLSRRAPGKHTVAGRADLADPTRRPLAAIVARRWLTSARAFECRSV